MSKKKITIKPTTSFRNKEKKIDEWVLGSSIEKGYNNELSKSSDNEDLMSRFTIVIPKLLHKRIKKYCVVNDKKMKDVLTEILSKSFPET